MRKFVLTLCASLILFWSVYPNVPVYGAGAETGRASAAAAQSSSSMSNLPKSDENAAASSDSKYKEGKGDNAIYTNIAIDIGLYILGATLGTALQTTKQIVTLGVVPWFPIFISTNIMEAIGQLAHAAVIKYMMKSTEITASFTGTEGFVTDKWVGPPARNKTIAILGDVNVSSQSFGALAFDPKEYEGVKDPKTASARELMDYRNKVLMEDQRSLSNVADENWGVRYRAQQRSIKALAGALALKKELAALAEADTRISAEYGSKTQALNTVASRRSLYDALLLLKMNVMAARNKIRAETLELDFKPITEEPEDVDEKPEDTPTPTPPLTPTTGA